MASILTIPQERLMALLIKQADSRGGFSFKQLRAAGIPEQTKVIFHSRATVLDSLLKRKLLELNHGGWLAMALNGSHYSIINR